jgi:hypothetical protein
MSKAEIDLKKVKLKCNNPLCEKRKECTERATDWHHMFPQTQQHRRQYGSLLDEAFNLLPLSNRCHLQKPIPTFNEVEFIEAGEKAGFRIRHLAGKSLQYKRF